MFKEQRRQAYLQAMGIEVYYPRRALPGAAPSPAYELPPPAAADSAASSPSTAPGKSPERVAGPARELLADALRPSRREQREGEERNAPTRPQQAALTQPQPDAASEALHFLLHYQLVDSRLALLCELPPEAGRESLAQSRQLLAAVLRALGVMTLDNPVETFSWPMMPDMPAAQSGADQARQALGGFLAQRRERAGFGNLLVFSAQIDALLPGADKHSGRDYAHGTDCHVTCTHSLHSMLALPELKREAWEHLQPLRRRLQESARA